MKRVLIIFFIIIIVTAGTSYSNDKAYIDDFIDFSSNIDGRITAMGSVGTVMTDNASSVILNPSLMSTAIVPTVTLDHIIELYGTNTNHFSFVKPGDNYHYGFSIIMQSFDSKYFVKRDIYGKESGNFNIGDNAIIGAYTRKIKLFKKKMLLGFKLKYITKEVGQFSGSAFDLGISYYNKIKKKIGLGIVLDNVLGSKIAEDALPRRLKCGLSYDLFENKLLTAFQIDIVASQFNYHFGGEYRLLKFLAFRAGMDKNSISFGFGLNYADYNLNYVFKKINSLNGESDLSTFGFNWTIGYSRLQRLKVYSKHKNIAIGLIQKSDYTNALKELELAKNALKRKKDKLEYDEISVYYENTKNLYKNIQEDKRQIEQESKNYIGKAKKLIIDKQYEPAIAELKKIVKESNYYEEAQKLIRINNKKSEKLKASGEKQVEYNRLLKEYKRAKDLYLKIELGKMLLSIKETTKIKKQLAGLKKWAGKRKLSARALADVKRNLNLINQRQKKSKAQEYYSRAQKYYKKGYFELVRDELKTGQELLGDMKWQSKFLAKVELKISEKIEQQAKIEAIKKLFKSGFNYFANGDYSSARDQLKRILEMEPKHNEAKSLLQKIEDLSKKKNIKVKKVERKLSLEEIKYRNSKIERLFNEGTSLYTAGNLKEARLRWQNILELDPDNLKAKRYLEMIKQ